MGVSIDFRILQLCDFTSDLLNKFNRYQEVKRCWRKENSKWILKDISFIEQWDESDKAKRVTELIGCLEHGGFVFGAYFNSHLIGFASIEKGFFGSNKEYVQLGMLHVSCGHRGNGIGKKLFSIICEKAIQIGAKKIYISAHSSEESQAFYKAVGCTDAKEVNQMLADREPCDCQLEYIL